MQTPKNEYYGFLVVDAGKYYFNIKYTILNNKVAISTPMFGIEFEDIHNKIPDEDQYKMKEKGFTSSMIKTLYNIIKNKLNRNGYVLTRRGALIEYNKYSERKL